MFFFFAAYHFCKWIGNNSLLREKVDIEKELKENFVACMIILYNTNKTLYQSSRWFGIIECVSFYCKQKNSLVSYLKFNDKVETDSSYAIEFSQ